MAHLDAFAAAVAGSDAGSSAVAAAGLPLRAAGASSLAEDPLHARLQHLALSSSHDPNPSPSLLGSPSDRLRHFSCPDLPGGQDLPPRLRNMPLSSALPEEVPYVPPKPRPRSRHKSVPFATPAPLAPLDQLGVFREEVPYQRPAEHLLGRRRKSSQGPVFREEVPYEEPPESMRSRRKKSIVHDGSSGGGGGERWSSHSGLAAVDEDAKLAPIKRMIYDDDDDDDDDAGGGGSGGAGLPAGVSGYFGGAVMSSESGFYEAESNQQTAYPSAPLKAIESAIRERSDDMDEGSEASETTAGQGQNRMAIHHLIGRQLRV